MRALKSGQFQPIRPSNLSQCTMWINFCQCGCYRPNWQKIWTRPSGACRAQGVAVADDGNDTKLYDPSTKANNIFTGLIPANSTIQPSRCTLRMWMLPWDELVEKVRTRPGRACPGTRSSSCRWRKWYEASGYIRQSWEQTRHHPCASKSKERDWWIIFPLKHACALSLLTDTTLDKHQAQRVVNGLSMFSGHFPFAGFRRDREKRPWQFIPPFRGKSSFGVPTWALLGVTRKTAYSNWSSGTYIDPLRTSHSRAQHALTTAGYTIGKLSRCELAEETPWGFNNAAIAALSRLLQAPLVDIASLCRYLDLIS